MPMRNAISMLAGASAASAVSASIHEDRILGLVSLAAAVGAAVSAYYWSEQARRRDNAVKNEEARRSALLADAMVTANIKDISDGKQPRFPWFLPGLNTRLMADSGKFTVSTEGGQITIASETPAPVPSTAVPRTAKET